MRISTDKESDEIWKEVEFWYKRGGRFMFEDNSMGAKAAIAEYLANQKGFTLFESKTKLIEVCYSCKGEEHTPDCTHKGINPVFIVAHDRELLSEYELRLIHKSRERRAKQVAKNKEQQSETKS